MLSLPVVRSWIDPSLVVVDLVLVDLESCKLCFTLLDLDSNPC